MPLVDCWRDGTAPWRSVFLSWATRRAAVIQHFLDSHTHHRYFNHSLNLEVFASYSRTCICQRPHRLLQVFSNPAKRFLKQLDNVRRVARTRVLWPVIVLEFVRFINWRFALVILQISASTFHQQLSHDILVPVHRRQVQCAIAVFRHQMHICTRSQQPVGDSAMATHGAVDERREHLLREAARSEGQVISKVSQVLHSARPDGRCLTISSFCQLTLAPASSNASIASMPLLSAAS